MEDKSILIKKSMVNQSLHLNRTNREGSRTGTITSSPNQRRRRVSNNRSNNRSHRRRIPSRRNKTAIPSIVRSTTTTDEVESGSKKIDSITVILGIISSPSFSICPSLFKGAELTQPQSQSTISRIICISPSVKVA